MVTVLVSGNLFLTQYLVVQTRLVARYVVVIIIGVVLTVLTAMATLTLAQRSQGETTCPAP